MSLVVPEPHQQFQVQTHSLLFGDMLMLLLAHSASLEHQRRWQAQDYVCVDGD